MRINDLDPSGSSGLSPTGAAGVSGSGTYGHGGRVSYGQNTDQVQLSGASMVAALAIADHSARLAQLKAQVASGQYNPPADAIGRSLVSEAISRTSLQ